VPNCILAAGRYEKPDSLIRTSLALLYRPDIKHVSHDGEISSTVVW